MKFIEDEGDSEWVLFVGTGAVVDSWEGGDVSVGDVGDEEEGGGGLGGGLIVLGRATSTELAVSVISYWMVAENLPCFAACSAPCTSKVPPIYRRIVRLVQSVHDVASCSPVADMPRKEYRCRREWARDTLEWMRK